MSEIPPNLRAIIRKHALLNAYKHEGKADTSAVISKVLGEDPQLKQMVKTLIELVKEVVAEVNRMSVEEQFNILNSEYPELLLKETRVKFEGRILPPLPQAKKGEVVTRFPPEPNGYPHIGHAKAAIIDETYARMYDGKFILRFDDTNPAKEKLEYYDAILDGLKWLGIKPDIIKNTSDDIELFYEYAERLIKAGHCYVCTCEPIVIKRNRAEGRECACRERAIEKNLELWNRMFSTFKQNEAILRLKVDMKHVNTALRDPTLFRIVEAEHPLKKDRYRVWPTYDFAVAIEDSLDGVTHAMRTKEYELRDELYYLLLRLLNLRQPLLIEFSRLELEGTPVAKRFLKPLVDNRLVSGWDDPRMPTLVGLRRRGILPEAIREFILSLGVSKVESKPSWDILESFNRKLLDPIAKRYFFVPNPVMLEVQDAPHLKVRLKHHPNLDLGYREIEAKDHFYISRDDLKNLKVGDRVRLMDLYNVKLIEKGEDSVIGSFAGSEIIEGIPKVQWVTERYIEFTVLIPGPLYIGDRFNEESLKVERGFAEEACSGLKVGEMIQFVRFGFCRIDAPSIAILTHK
ncbi:MAG: glutamate--tRNA ligase [Nitrososphaerales archaeon]|nr:glutamate--tRNA ligase [Nitrososphaerales archaeon]